MLTEVFTGGSLSKIDANEPIATSVMVSAAMLLDAMICGDGWMVNRWVHAAYHRQNIECDDKRQL